MELDDHEFLIGGLEHFIFFHPVGNVIIPTDFRIFFRGVGMPPTRFFELYHPAGPHASSNVTGKSHNSHGGHVK